MSQWKERLRGRRVWLVLLLLASVAVSGTLLQLQSAGQGTAVVAGQQNLTSTGTSGADFRSMPFPGSAKGSEFDALRARAEDLANRYTYPLGYYDAKWLQAAEKQVAKMQAAIPAGRVVYNRANSNSPLALDPNAMVSLGPKPGQANGCQDCYSYGKVSGRINSVAIHPVVTSTVYLGVSNGGIWKSTNCCSAATTWASVTDDPLLSTISIDEVTLDPTNPDTIYAATGDFRAVSAARGSQGILKSTDAGATWTVLGEDVFTPNRFDSNPLAFDPHQSVSAVKVDPNNPSRLIAGTEKDLRMSYDGGQTWSASCATNPYPTQQQVNTEILVRDDGTTSTIFYAVGWYDGAANGANGIYTATWPSSGCPIWTLITTGSNGWPANTGNGSASYSKPGRIDIAIAPSNSQIMYAGVADPGLFDYGILGIWSTTNAGASWSKRADMSDFSECDGGSASYGQAFYDQTIEVDPNNPAVLYYGEVDAFRSTDGGLTWQNVGCVYSGGNWIHPDQQDFRYLPGSSSQLLFANDGGIWFTNNANVALPTRPTIISLNETMNTLEFYNGDITGNFATAAQPGANGGTQDNGSFVNTWTNTASLGAEEWQLRVGGDGFFAAIEPVNNQVWYQSGNGSYIYRSTTGPYGFYSDATGGWISDGRAFAMPYEIYKHDCPTTGCTHLIAGSYRVYETVNGGTNWYLTSPQLTKTTPSVGWSRRPNILQLSYSPSLSTTAIVGTSDGNVQFGFNLGQVPTTTATWANVTLSNTVLPNRPIVDVTIDPLNPLVGYAAVGAFNESTPSTPGHVFQVTCTPGCVSAVWLDKTGNLPNLPANAIMVNPKFRQQVFVGTDAGLFFTNDIDSPTPVWMRFTNGLPNVWVADLTVDRGFTTLAVWTRNRGLYAWPLPSAPFGGPTATPTPTTSTATATPDPVPTQTATATPDPVPTQTATATPDPVPTGSATATPDPSPTAIATSTGTPTSTGTVPTSTTTSTATITVQATSTNPAASSTSTSTGTVMAATSTAVASSTVAGATSTSVATAAATATACAINFPDNQPGDTFYTYIRCLACRGVITGYADGMFHAERNITRGQISKVVSNAAGFNEDPGPQIYQDVPPGSTYYAYINRLTNRGIMSGYPCPTRPDGSPCSPDDPAVFRPNANATRGQLAKIVSNAIGFSEAVSGQHYADVPPSGEGSQFYEWIMRLTNRGVMSGYPCGGSGEPCDGQNRPYFRWNAQVTRGQASKIVANTFFPNCVP